MATSDDVAPRVDHYGISTDRLLSTLYQYKYSGKVSRSIVAGAASTAIAAPRTVPKLLITTDAVTSITTAAPAVGRIGIGYDSAWGNVMASLDTSGEAQAAIESDGLGGAAPGLQLSAVTGAELAEDSDHWEHHSARIGYRSAVVSSGLTLFNNPTGTFAKLSSGFTLPGPSAVADTLAKTNAKRSHPHAQVSDGTGLKSYSIGGFLVTDLTKTFGARRTGFASSSSSSSPASDLATPASASASSIVTDFGSAAQLQFNDSSIAVKTRNRMLGYRISYDTLVSPTLQIGAAFNDDVVVPGKVYREASGEASAVTVGRFLETGMRYVPNTDTIVKAKFNSRSEFAAAIQRSLTPIVDMSVAAKWNLASGSAAGGAAGAASASNARHIPVAWGIALHAAF